MSNKVKYGLKNAYYAPLTMVNGKTMYETPIAIKGAVSISLSPEGDPVEFEADDSVYFEETSNNGYSGDLEFALIPDEFKRDIMGETIDSNGAMIENVNAKFRPFALMFEFNGDRNATRHVLYNCRASRTDIASKTKGKTIDVTPEKLSITVRPAEDTSDVKAKLYSGQTGYDTFFSGVYLKNSPTNSTAEQTIQFSKGEPEDTTFDMISTSANALRSVRINGELIPGIYLTVTGIDFTVDSSYFSSLEVGEYQVSAEFETGNNVMVTVKIVE